MSGGGGAGPLGQVINQAQNAQQSTSNPYASQGTPLGQQPITNNQPYSFGSQGFNSPQQQYQPGGGYGMNQGYGSPFGGMGGYGSPFGGYGSPFGGYGSPFGGYGSPFGGMGGYGMNQGYGGFGQQMGGYGSPFGGGYGKQMGGYGMNPYAQAMAQQGMGGGFGRLGGMSSTFELKPEQMGQPRHMGTFAVLTPQQMAQDIPGPQGYTPQQAVNAPSLGQAMDSVGGLGGLAQMLRGRAMFNKGGTVDE